MLLEFTNDWVKEMIFFLIILASLILTECIRRYLLKINFLDRPNDRSSHSVATPRGGGLSIVACFFLVIGFSDFLSVDIVIALMGAGILVAAVGFWDDQSHIAARWRLIAHFSAAAWVLFYLKDISELQMFTDNLHLDWIGYIIIAFVLVWLLNLFNFMDGIDGIAAVETIFIASVGGYFSYIDGLINISYISFVLAASTLGFLILNWPPAKIFMGDVGSGFVGLMLGIIAYASILEGMLIWTWLILFAIFLVDSSLTLIRRILNGDKWYEAHCSHAYQNAAKKWSHKKVTVSVIIINLFWVFPLAFYSYTYPDFGFMLTLLTFIPLVIVALKFKAGITIS